MKDNLLPKPQQMTRVVHGMVIVTGRYLDIADEVMSYGNVSFTIPAAMLQRVENTNVKVCISVCCAIKLRKRKVCVACCYS